jgi:hypothetical protein
MEITGKIKQFLPEVTGEGRNGTWKKQEFILETQDQYPKTVCIAVWGDKINLSEFKEGEVITAGINIESREYNSRWYTDVKAWKIAKEGSSPAAPPPAEGGYPADLPPPAESEDEMLNDLPF